MGVIKKIIEGVKRETDALLGEASKDTRFSSEHVYPDEQQAIAAFVQSVNKLFAVNDWSNLPGITSVFHVYDAGGLPKPAGKPLVGDYVRIDLPGPTPENWVVITDINSSDNQAELTVKPSHNPQTATPTEGEPKPVEHFFGGEASSTFRVERQGNRIVASEIGQNERINNEGTEAGDRPIINTLIAEGGWAYFQRVQWKKLTDYLVHLQPD